MGCGYGAVGSESDTRSCDVSHVSRWVGTITLTTATLGLASAADLEMHDIGGFSVLGRTGTYPDGVSGISMSTTICNGGADAVPWQAMPFDDRAS